MTKQFIVQMKCVVTKEVVCECETEEQARSNTWEFSIDEREKVVRQSQANDKLLFENAGLAGRLMQYEEPERYAAYCKALDDKNVAMEESKE